VRDAVLVDDENVEPGLGFRVQGSGFRVQGSGFRVQGLGFSVQGSGFRVQGSGFTTCPSPACPTAPCSARTSVWVWGSGLIESCIPQLKAQGPARTCNESKEEEHEEVRVSWGLGFSVG